MTHNILYLNRVSEIGGAAQSLLLLLSGLDRDRFCPMVVLPSPGPLADRLQALDIETIFIPLNRLRWRNPFPYLKTVSRLVALLRNRRFDLVHANIGFCNQYAAVAARLTGTPSICHVRNIKSRVSFWEHGLWLAHVLIANSQATLDSVRGRARKAQRVELVYNGVDLTQFAPRGDRHFRQQLGLGEETFVLGMVGRVTTEKGQHTFIRSLQAVFERQSDACALIVGDVVIDGTQEYLKQLKRMVSELGLSANVLFTGFVEDTPAVYDSIDLLVMPSVAEPFGRVLIEAMAMQKPVIATRAGGALEVVDEEVTGLLVPPDRPDSLAEAIMRIMGNEVLGKKMGVQGRKRVERLFSSKQNVARTESIYQDILGRSGNA